VLKKKGGDVEKKENMPIVGPMRECPRKGVGENRLVVRTSYKRKELTQDSWEYEGEFDKT